MRAGETITDTAGAQAEIAVFALATGAARKDASRMIRPLALSVAFFLSATAAFAEDPTPTPEPPPVVQASDADGIRALAGKPATVEGRIIRIGSPESGSIKFINFADAGSGGFVAVVFKSNFEAFPEGFDSFKGAKVQVTGPVTIYKETTPQIVLKSPDQIKVIEAAPTPTPTEAN